MDKIVVLDFGSQYSHLICRRIRDFSVYAELLPFDTPLEKINEINPKGIILSGGPSSVYDSDAPVPDGKIFQLQVPILGICYGIYNWDTLVDLFDVENMGRLLILFAIIFVTT